MQSTEDLANGCSNKTINPSIVAASAWIYNRYRKAQLEETVTKTMTITH